MVKTAKRWQDLTPEEKCKSLKCNWKSCGPECVRAKIDKAAKEWEAEYGNK